MFLRIRGDGSVKNLVNLKSFDSINNSIFNINASDFIDWCHFVFINDRFFFK